MNRHALAIVAPLLCVNCALKDAQTVAEARTKLLGMTEVDLEACLGAPDQHATFGNTDILTYYATSTSNSGFSLGLPLVGGLNLTGGGYCHATFRLEDGRVAEVRYTGETSATLAPNAYCAPIVRSCINHPEGPTGNSQSAATTHPTTSARSEQEGER